MVLYSKGKLFYIIMEASYIHPDLEVRDPVGHPVGHPVGYPIGDPVGDLF